MPTGKASPGSKKALAKAKRLAQEEREKEMEVIEFSIGLLNGDSMNMQIKAGENVLDIIEKYENALNLSKADMFHIHKCHHRLSLNSTTLRGYQCVRDVGIVTGSHVTVVCKRRPN